MRICPLILNASCRPRSRCISRHVSRRFLLTLAIETSCDDTAVSILETWTSGINGRTSAVLHFNKKITSNNTAYHGVHPLASLYSHQQNLASLVDEAIQRLPSKDAFENPSPRAPVSFSTRRIPDFISVTRGPGMRSNLFTGIDTAKGLAAAWQIDLVGVHHMQAHALTPRLVAALHNLQIVNPTYDGAPSEPHTSAEVHVEPTFPFLSILASGGHTLLIHSESLVDHRVLGTTKDIAIGECLDKVARVVLPSSLLQTARSTMYGALLEKFAFTNDTESDGSKVKLQPEQEDHGETVQKTKFYPLEDSTAGEYQAMHATRYSYVVPKNYENSSSRDNLRWGWALNQPLAKAAGGLKRKILDMSFSGLTTAVERIARYGTDRQTGKLNKVERSPEDLSIEERKDIARETMRAAFEHVASRVVLGLQQISTGDPASTRVATVVMSGGVAANSYLRYILAKTLVAHGYPNVRIVFPPPSLCTDNAAMIAWAGSEMYYAGYKDLRSIRAIRKWPLDSILTPQEDT